MRLSWKTRLPGDLFKKGQTSIGHWASLESTKMYLLVDKY